MPRNVRPAWLETRAGGRTVATGPRDRTGSLDATLTLRDHGTVAAALDVSAIGSGDGLTVSAMVETRCHGWTMRTPTGDLVAVPKGTILRLTLTQ